MSQTGLSVSERGYLKQKTEPGGEKSEPFYNPIRETIQVKQSTSPKDKYRLAVYSYMALSKKLEVVLGHDGSPGTWWLTDHLHGILDPISVAIEHSYFAPFGV